MAKKKHKESEEDIGGVAGPVAHEPLGRAILVGNHVAGFMVYPMPDVSEADTRRLLAHVPESRLIEVHPFEELIDKHGDLPEPNDTHPKNKPVEAADGDAGPASSGAEETATGDTGGTGDGESE